MERNDALVVPGSPGATMEYRDWAESHKPQHRPDTRQSPDRLRIPESIEVGSAWRRSSSRFAYSVSAGRETTLRILPALPSAQYVPDDIDADGRRASGWTLDPTYDLIDVMGDRGSYPQCHGTHIEVHHHIGGGLR